MGKVHESRCMSKCVLSERFVAHLQPFIRLMESDWHNFHSTMDPFTEALFRQAHEALAKLHEAHVWPGEGRCP